VYALLHFRARCAVPLLKRTTSLPPQRYYNYRVPRTLQEVLDALFQGLRRLEYRGYDSAGLCVDADDSAALKAWPAAAAANGSHGGGGGGGAVANGSSETGPRPVR
jgi:hypothetical protein